MENTISATVRPTRMLLSLLTTIACVEAPIWVVDRGILVGNAIAAGQLPSFVVTSMLALNLFASLLGLTRGLVFLVLVHRYFTNAIDRGAFLRVSARRAVVHYFVPILSLFAPRRDMLDLLEATSREAPGSPVARHARATVNRWWAANVGASVTAAIAYFLPEGPWTQVAGVSSVAFTVATIVLSIRVLRLVETRVECFEADRASTFA